jgi:hypothetical protein
MKLSAREIELKAMRVAEAERQEKLLPAQSNGPSQSNAQSNGQSNKPGFDRTAYQREYMRRRRAAKGAAS